MLLSGNPMVKLLEARQARLPQAPHRALQFGLLFILLALFFSNSVDSRTPACWSLILLAPIPVLFRFLKLVKETAPGERCFPLRPSQVIDGFAWHSVVSVMATAWWTIPVLIAYQVFAGGLTPSLFLPYLALGWLGLLCSALLQSYFWVAVTVKPWQVLLAYFGCSWFLALPFVLTQQMSPSTPFAILVTPFVLLGATAVLREIGSVAYEQNHKAPTPGIALHPRVQWWTARLRSLCGNPILLREMDRGSKRPTRWVLWRLPVLAGLACAAQHHLEVESPESFVALSFVVLGFFSFALASVSAARLLGQDLAPPQWEALRQTGLGAREFVQGAILSTALPRLVEMTLPIMFLAYVAQTRGGNPFGVLLPAAFAVIAPFLGAIMAVRERIGFPDQARPYTRSVSLIYLLLCTQSQMLFKTSSIWFLGVPPLALLETWWLWTVMTPMLNQNSLLSLRLKGGLERPKR